MPVRGLDHVALTSADVSDITHRRLVVLGDSEQALHLDGEWIDVGQKIIGTTTFTRYESDTARILVLEGVAVTTGVASGLDDTDGLALGADDRLSLGALTIDGPVGPGSSAATTVTPKVTVEPYHAVDGEEQPRITSSAHWVRDFVDDLGHDADEADPNQHIAVSLPDPTA